MRFTACAVNAFYNFYFYLVEQCSLYSFFRCVKSDTKIINFLKKTLGVYK